MVACQGRQVCARMGGQPNTCSLLHKSCLPAPNRSFTAVCGSLLQDIGKEEFLLGKPHPWKARSNNPLGECYLGPRQGVFLTILYGARMCVYVSWSEPASQYELIVQLLPQGATQRQFTHISFHCYYKKPHNPFHCCFILHQKLRR